MNDEALARALGSLRMARMSEVASDRVRERLEAAWRDRDARPRRRALTLMWIARPAVLAVSIVLLVYATMHAGAETPLYLARVAVEDALIVLQADKAAYANDLYDERLAEAARHEASGNALAASRARSATEDALRLLKSVAPTLAEQEPSPEPSPKAFITAPTPTPTPDVTASPTPNPTTEPTARPTARPTVAPTKPLTPKPATPKPTVKPSPTATATPMLVHATGDVLYTDGSRVDGACVSLTIDGNCVSATVNGRIDMTLLAKKGQSITIYVRNYFDTTRPGLMKGKVTVTVGGTEVLLGTITLRPV